jgi:hypothetical protein
MQHWIRGKDGYAPNQVCDVVRDSNMSVRRTFGLKTRMLLLITTVFIVNFCAQYINFNIKLQISMNIPLK